jgi:hypothetical protein
MMSIAIFKTHKSTVIMLTCIRYHKLIKFNASHIAKHSIFLIKFHPAHNDDLLFTRKWKNEKIKTGIATGAMATQHYSISNSQSFFSL